MKTPTDRASPRLTDDDVALVKGMIRRGDIKHAIAQYFGVNPGRVYDAVRLPKYAAIEPADVSRLPPPGPYVVVNRVEYRQAILAQETVNELLRSFDQIASVMRSKLAALASEDSNATA